jgi:hypothetical protein
MRYGYPKDGIGMTSIPNVGQIVGDLFVKNDRKESVAVDVMLSPRVAS